MRFWSPVNKNLVVRFHHSLPRTAIVLASRTNRRSRRRPSSSGSLASGSSPGETLGYWISAVKQCKLLRDSQSRHLFIYLFIYLFIFHSLESLLATNRKPKSQSTLATRMVAGKKDRGTGDENDDMLLIDCFLILFTDFSIFQRFNVDGTRG